MMKPLNTFGSFVLFGIPATWFLLLTRLFLPYLSSLGLHPALSWFITGLAVFVPLFVAAITFTFREGFKTKHTVYARLRLNKLSRSDWRFVIFGTISAFILSGFIMIAATLLMRHFGLPPLKTSPDFLQFEPLTGSQRWLLLVWLVMFFFNIFGEELLWRGYILPRQEIAFGTHAWAFNSFLWLMFHLCFGFDLMVMLLPIMVILPYVVHITRNTTVGILIHALYNGPVFILVATGVIG
ncbi:MAG: CPBP family intramembrane metalloprotease [Bacteroidetes bacterium]|nr:CPBP family intramembrane metalloprotease [Bacteroidota bacterium]